MAKFRTSSSISMLAIVGYGDDVDVGSRDNPRASIKDGDGVDVGIEDGPCASRCDGDGLTSVRGGDGVDTTSEDLTSIDTVDEDGVDDVKLSLGGSSLTTSFFLPTCPFPTRFM